MNLPKIARIALAIVVGAVVWVAVATAANLAVRWFLPGYADAERSMDFSLPMLIARLVVAAAASLAAGAACAATARRVPSTSLWLGLLLVIVFVPVHVSLWQKFPAWYHLLFLGSLVPLVVAGARFPERRRDDAA